MRLRPIQADHFALTPTMIRCDQSAVRSHQLRARPPGLKDSGARCPPRDLFPFRSDVLRVGSLPKSCSRTTPVRSHIG